MTNKVEKVLVLTSRTGGGHDARAEAFRDWVSKIYGSDVKVRIDHTLEDSSKWNRLGVELYNTIQKNHPFFHHIYYHIGEFFGLFQHRKVPVGLPYYDQLIREYQPDVIFSVHSMLNRGPHSTNCRKSERWCPQRLGFGHSAGRGASAPRLRLLGRDDQRENGPPVLDSKWECSPRFPCLPSR